ncbi:altered inheritance rate of mitochondria protein 25 isoform X2 [Elaeis guineensis]|uniref:Phospholipid scramblase n=1 Tax=Elaeis guineensis var. tenera TaxID=51953 RepID=A0A6I9SGQ4_ELAGV|nr:altered inheritance rate of mitochondria protein 25 isoform X2 [Elaeis guineensis]
MRWLEKLLGFPKAVKITSKISKFGSLLNQTADKYLVGPYNDRRSMSKNYCDELHQKGWLCCSLSPQYGLGNANVHLPTNLLSSDNLSKLQYDMGNHHNMLQIPLSRRFGSVGKEYSMSREWLTQLWLEEKRRTARRRSRRKQVPAKQEIQVKIIEQPPISQYDEDLCHPSSPEEVRLAPLLARANLLITRDIEWANIMFAFEQESRYVIVDASYPQSPVGFIREQSNIIFRQVLRSRRPFIAYILDGMGNEIFRVRRPFWLINSTIYAEVDGKEIGVVNRRWHLWRRIYDLYLGNKQFAVVENPGFWDWTFTLKDENDNVLAQINRDWRGLGLELFTDAGQYVIRFGNADSSSGLASVIPELKVARPLSLSERAVAVALAVSLDSDYFSRRGGWGLPLVIAGE